MTYLATESRPINLSKERNQKIKEKLEILLNKINEDDNLILMGDFNGHIGIIGKSSLAPVHAGFSGCFVDHNPWETHHRQDTRLRPPLSSAVCNNQGSDQEWWSFAILYRKCLFNFSLKVAVLFVCLIASGMLFHSLAASQKKDRPT